MLDEIAVERRERDVEPGLGAVCPGERDHLGLGGDGNRPVPLGEAGQPAREPGRTDMDLPCAGKVVASDVHHPRVPAGSNSVAAAAAGSRSAARTSAIPASTTTPPTACSRVGPLVEQQPGEQHCEQHLGQSDERREPGAEPARRGDPGDVGDRSGDHGQPARSARASSPRRPASSTSACRRAHRQHADGAEHRKRHRPERQSRPGRDDRRQRRRRSGPRARSRRRGPSRRRDPTARRRGRPAGSPVRSSTSTSPTIAASTADDGQPAGPLPVPQPHPADDEQDPGVLEQQRHGHRQVLDGVEVEQLGATRRRSRRRRAPSDQFAPQQRPAPTQLQHGRHGEDEGGDADPDGHRGARAPSGGDERGAEEPGGAERGGRRGRRVRDPRCSCASTLRS